MNSLFKRDMLHHKSISLFLTLYYEKNISSHGLPCFYNPHRRGSNADQLAAMFWGYEC